MKNLSYASLLVSVAISSLAAQEPPRNVGKSQEGTAARYQASHLIGCAVNDSKAKSLGVIQDIVLDVGHRRIAYAVVDLDKSLGKGEKCFVMPWRLFDVGPSNATDKLHATLSLDRTTLTAAPGFKKGERPDVTEANWSKAVDSYYNSQKDRPQHDVVVPQDRALTRGMPSHRFLSDVYGTEIVDARNVTLATAEDLVVNAESASVDCVLLSFGGNLGRGEHFALVPCESLSATPSGAMTLPCAKAGLEAMTLKGGQWPTLNNDTWLTNVRKSCAEACEEARAGDGDVIPEDASTVPAAAFADSYDHAKVETIKGKIMTVGSVSVGKGEPEQVRLRVAVDKNRQVLVYAAPASFEHQQALMLHPGDTVEVTGAPAKHCTHTVLVASDISSSGKTAKLRDSQGHPIWAKK